jgi:hypothetical protein
MKAWGPYKVNVRIPEPDTLGLPTGGLADRANRPLELKRSSKPPKLQQRDKPNWPKIDN